MEWSFEGPKGAVTVRQEGRCAVCQAISRTGEAALFKAYLLGEEGRALLGTLIPEGGALRLRRSIEVAQLKRQGAWPPTGAEIMEAYSFVPESPPEGWNLCREPGKLMTDPLLRREARRLGPAFLKRDEEGFVLAVAWSKGKPFPLPPLFCLAWPERLGGKWYMLFRFSRQGKPELLHKFSGAGENRGRL